MKKTAILILLSALFYFPTLKADTSYECTAQFAVVDGYMHISFYIQRTGGDSFNLGNSDFNLQVNNMALDFTGEPKIIRRGVFDLINNSDYQQIQCRRDPTEGWVGLQIRLKQNRTGVTVPDTPALLATVAMRILNPDTTNDGEWRLNVTTNPTVVLTYDFTDITPDCYRFLMLYQ